METKLFELRDAATFVPVICVALDPRNQAEHYLLRRSGYGPKSSSSLILMSGLAGGSDKSTCSPFDWSGNRTKQVAHKYIEENWKKLKSGQVIDVEYILGVRASPKISEALE